MKIINKKCALGSILILTGIAVFLNEIFLQRGGQEEAYTARTGSLFTPQLIRAVAPSRNTIMKHVNRSANRSILNIFRGQLSLSQRPVLTSRYTKMKFGPVYLLGVSGGNTSSNVSWDIFKVYGSISISLYKIEGFTCCLKYDTLPRKHNIVAVAPLQKFRHWVPSTLVGIHITCPNERHAYGDVPVSVALSYANFTCNERHVVYVTPFYPIREPHMKVAIGTKMAFGDVSAELIIEWMETYKYLGVDKILTYLVGDINEDARKVLEYYATTEVLDLYHHEPAAAVELPRTNHPPNPQKWTDNHLVVLDSFEKMSGYRYFGIFDHDEFLIPTRNRSLKQVLVDLEQQYPENTAGFVFKSQLFYRSWYPSETNDLILIDNVKRSEFAPHVDRQKSFHKPEFTAHGGAHTHTVTLKKGYEMRVVPADEAFIRHYRQCTDENYQEFSHEFKRVIDHSVATWSECIKDNVRCVRKRIFA